jgi:hypothetical protein
MRSSLSTCKSIFVQFCHLEDASNSAKVLFSLAQRSSPSAYVLLSSNMQETGELCLYWKNSVGKNTIIITTMSARAASVNVPVAAKLHHRDPNGIGEQGK